MFSTFRRNDGISADEPRLEHDGVVIRHRELGILRADADRLDIRAEDKAVDDIELRAGASGWRLDVADELPDWFLEKIRAAMEETAPDSVLIGEVWEDATTKFAYGQRRRYLLGNQLDSVMNYPFAAAILHFVRYGGGQAFLDAILSITEHYPPQVTAVLMNHIGTHDTLRAITALAGPDCTGQGRAWQHRNNTLSGADYARGVQLLKLASFLQYTLPGVPSLYYGDEVGVQGMNDPFNRG